MRFSLIVFAVSLLGLQTLACDDAENQQTTQTSQESVDESSSEGEAEFESWAEMFAALREQNPDLDQAEFESWAEMFAALREQNPDLDQAEFESWAEMFAELREQNPNESVDDSASRNLCEEWADRWIDVMLAVPDISGGYESLAAGPEILQPQFQAMADTWRWVSEALPSDQQELIENSRILADRIAAIVPLLTKETADQIDFSEHNELVAPISAYVGAECIGLLNGIDPRTMFIGLEEIS